MNNVIEERFKQLEERISKLEDIVRRMNGYKKCKCGKWLAMNVITCSCGEKRW